MKSARYENRFPRLLYEKENIGETINEFINEQDHLSFLLNPADIHRISGIYGGAILSELEQADEAIFQQTGIRLLGDLDHIFDRSEAVIDLASEPKDDGDLGNKISILAAIMDKFKIKKPGEKDGNIKALEHWLADKVGAQAAKAATEPFVRIRDLRNQYPVHDKFEDRNGNRAVKQAIVDAEAFFEFRAIDGPPDKWKKICDVFRDAVQKNLKTITDADKK